MNYFIEGLQGSGKSTLVQKISERKPNCVAIREGEYSPVELSWCAYMDEKTYQEKLDQYPDMRQMIEEKTYSEGDKKIVCYTKIKTAYRSFYKDLEQYEIYNNRISYDDFKSIILSRYRAWNQDHMIFECSLFQNIVEDMILFRCASDDEIMDFYQDIHNVLDGEKYHIIYLKTDNIRGNLNVIRKERSDDKGNEIWFPLMMRFFNESPYAKANGLNGEDDLIKHFNHRQELELRICEEIFAGQYTIIPSKEYSDSLLDNNDLYHAN